MSQPSLPDLYLRRGHLLGIEGMSRAEITAIIDTAAAYKLLAADRALPRDLLRGRTVATLFFEDSTRTRNSFEIAAKRLGADIIGFTSSGSSMSKGETVDDTAKTVRAMGIDAVVVRHKSAGVPAHLFDVLKLPVINAGDGAHEHPTQALLDALTLREVFGKIAGLRVWIIGDITHSRVARSNIFSLGALGAKVTICAPRTLVPPAFSAAYGVSVTHAMDGALRDADAVILLRIQKERQDAGLFPSMGEYAANFGLTLPQVAGSRIKAVLHPGPINRGVEISSDLADSEYSCIERQVANGVHVRTAILASLLRR
jgi:aspartate carbamoyltransferase catalytic subunit